MPETSTLGPGDVLVGHVARPGHGGGHTTWTCRTCDQTMYGQPLNTHCSTLDGPASAHLDTIEAMAHRAEVRATGLILLEPIRADPRPTYCSARHLLPWWRADCCVKDAS